MYARIVGEGKNNHKDPAAGAHDVAFVEVKRQENSSGPHRDRGVADSRADG
jgi:hypothetical protein